MAVLIARAVFTQTRNGEDARYARERADETGGRSIR